MFTYMKITDIHLRHDNLDHKVPALRWATELAIQQRVDAVFGAGDLVDHDNFGGRLTAPGGVVQAYFENFSIPLRDAGISIHHVRGNHDKRAARRGSALWCFAGYGTQIHEQVESWITQPKKNEWINFVFVPWLYPEELLGAKIAEEDPAAWHKRYLEEVHRLVMENWLSNVSYNVLVAHCRYAGAVMGGGRVCPADEGMVLSSDLLGAFNDLHLGDIHKRQEFPLGNGGYTGALSQEGLDEAGNPCGVEIVHLDDYGQIERTWHECPHSRRYEDLWVDEEEGAREMAPPSSGVIRRVRYLADGSDKAKAIAQVLEPLAREGVKIDPQFQLLHVESSKDQPALEILDQPEVALDHYCLMTGEPEESRLTLQQELEDLLGKRSVEQSVSEENIKMLAYP